jgi:multidrug resistance efflux pump
MFVVRNKDAKNKHPIIKFERNGTMNKKALFSLVLLVFMAAGLIGCDRMQVAGAAATPTSASTQVREDNGMVVVEGNIVPRDWTRIYTRTGGKVAEVLVKKGDEVKKDAAILRLVTYDDLETAQAALTAAKLEEVNAQQALDKLNESGDVTSTKALAAVSEATKKLIDTQQVLADLDTKAYQDDLDKYQQDLGTAKKELDDAQKEWDKYKDMDPTNQTRVDQKKKFDDAQKKYDDAVRVRDLQINKMAQAKADVEAAKSALADAQREADKHKNGGANADDLALAQTRLDNAKAQVAAAQKVVDGTTIVAPYDGTVVELDHVVGETLLPNQQAALVADLNELYVETNDLTEMDVVKVSEGDAARVKPDALSDLSLPAAVTEIQRNSGKKGGDVTYTVRLKLNSTDARLRWGMTVEIRFAGQ